MPKLIVVINPNTLHGTPLTARKRYRPYIVKFMPVASAFKLSWGSNVYMKIKKLPASVHQPRGQDAVINLTDGGLEFLGHMINVLPISGYRIPIKNSHDLITQQFED